MTAGVLDSRQKLVPEVFCRGIAGMTEVEAGTRDLKGCDKIVGFL